MASISVIGWTKTSRQNGFGGLPQEKLDYTNRQKKKLTDYSQRRRCYYLSETTANCPLYLALPISLRTVANSFKIEGPVAAFALLPPVNTLSDFEDELEWSTLSKGFDNAINDPTILLDKFILLEDGCTDLVEGIRHQ